MSHLIEIMNFIAGHGQAILTGVIGILMGIIAIAMVIPGEQPEKALQAIVDFLAKFSAKPKP